MKKRVGKIIGLVLGLVVLFLGIGVVKLIWFKPLSINHYFERVFWENTWANPQGLSSLRLLEQYGITGHNKKLTDISTNAKDEAFRRTERQLEILQQYDTASLSATELLSYNILRYNLRTDLEGQKWRWHDYPVNQLFGYQSDLPDFMINTHNIDNEADAKDYIQRLQVFGTAFDQLLEGLRMREKAGVMPPQFVLDRVIKEVQGFVKPAPADHILVSNLAAKLDTCTAKGHPITVAERKDLLNAATAAVSEIVYPAYQQLLSYLVAQQKIATSDDGVWKLPNGDAYYQYQLKVNTTSSYTADEIHQIGLAEVARIQHQMRTILASQGHTDTSDIGKAMENLAHDPRFLYPNDAQGRAQCLADYTSLINNIMAGMGQAFSTLPKAPVKVARIPEFKESTSPQAYYNSPSADGSRPGIFYTRLDILPETPKWGMATLAYHEAVPGHHFQIALQQEMEDLPLFRKYNGYNAYAEGWALYAERLASELGYIKDAYQDLGRLQAELFRAVRLVVDTGIHKKRWKRQKAIDYMVKNTGMGIQDVTSEIERYIVMPGQACGYKIGMIKILALREKAKAELGPKFSLPDFHAIVLNNGSMPLQVLEEVVDKYIKERKAKG